MKVKIKRIEPLQLGKLLAVIYALFSILFVPFMLIGACSSMGHGGGAGGLMFLLMPFLYIVLGFIGGIVGAFIYNVAAGWIGGMEVEFDVDGN